MNLLSWNIRGVGKGEKGLEVRAMIRRERVSFLGLIETKKKVWETRQVARLWPDDQFQYLACQASENSGGGVIAIWSVDVFEMSCCHKGDRWVMIEGNMVKENWECCIGVIYGGNSKKERMRIYDELVEVKRRINRPVLLVGDFNEVMSIEERKGQKRSNESISQFVEWINECNFVDLPIKQTRYTWRRGNSQSRIDRALCEVEWISNFPEIQVTCLGRHLSDHHPLLIQTKLEQQVFTAPFRSIDAWFGHPQFREFVENEWRALGKMPVHKGLKILKKPLRKWNREVFGNIEDRIRKIEKERAEVDKKLEDLKPEPCLIAREKALTGLLSKLQMSRCRIWIQKARTKQLSEKDRNSKYFHSIASMRRRANWITSLKQGERIITEKSELEAHINQHFRDLYS